MTFALLMPTVNEAIGLKAIVPNIDRSLFHEILVVDGNSTDGTPEVCEELGIKCIQQKEPGYPAAMFEAANVLTSDVIVTFSPDGNSLAERLPDLVAKMKEDDYAQVICSRYLGGNKSADDDFLTAIGNKMFTFLINLFFRANYTDSLVIFRAFRRELLETLEIRSDTFHHDKAGFDIQISVGCAMNHYKTSEIFGHEPARIGGVRKLAPWTNGLGISIYIVVKAVEYWTGRLFSGRSRAQKKLKKA